MKKIIFKVIRLSGLPFLFRELVQRNKVTIILFHDISPATADKVFGYLSRAYNIIDLRKYIEFRKNGTAHKLPSKSLIITFDDGYKTNYDLLPVLKKYGINITIFLCAGIINTRRRIWSFTDHPGYNTQQLKRVPTQTRYELLAEAGYHKEKEYEEAQLLNIEQIREMQPWVNFQSHTVFHPILTMCNDDEAEPEIVDSKRILEQQYGLTIDTISYPNGDYSEREIAISKKAGYTCGITVDHGYNDHNTDMLRLKRISGNDSDNLNEVIVKVSGVWGLLKRRSVKK